jgi:hypothetical protein
VSKPCDPCEGCPGCQTGYEAFAPPPADPVGEAVACYGVVRNATGDIVAVADEPKPSSPRAGYHRIPLYRHPARVTEADLSFIDGALLIDVDACAMGTATESHHDVAARDLRNRIVKLLAATVGGGK